ncbi:MAG: GNAT family N-acetyltransferase [Bdellovibrionales bacterium]|jgi:GNAT superfamily N-acetyltransferase|nr:GNAT family N-acetyltransferase [Bdellovibrionales bacterium]
MNASKPNTDSIQMTWLEKPRLWLERLLEARSTYEQQPSESWFAPNHQVLTLAKRSEREVGLSILWFQVSNPATSQTVFGAVLPDDRIILVDPSSPDTSRHGSLHWLVGFLQTKTVVRTFMGTRQTLLRLGLDTPQESKSQTSWVKYLSKTSETAQDSNALTIRRAQESDRILLQSWAPIFAQETEGGSARETLAEMLEWMRRGKLLLFNLAQAALSQAPPSPEEGTSLEPALSEPATVAMAALSGDFTDPIAGPTCRISLLFTPPELRNHGIGALALRAIEHEARMENIQALVLYSKTANQNATRFYARQGFVPQDEWLESPVSAFKVNTTG